MRFPSRIFAAVVAIFVVCAATPIDAATVTITLQDTNFPTQFNSGGDFFNQGTTELGMWANNNAKQTVAWKNFTTDGNNGGSARSLQVGDIFTITVSATRAFGQIGFSLNAGGTQGSSYANNISGSRMYISTDNYAAWSVKGLTNSGTASLSYAPLQSTYKDYKFTVKITSQSTADIYLTVDGTDYRAYNQTLAGTAGANISAFSIFGSDMWDGDSNDNAYWKQTNSVVDSGSVQLGYYMTSGTYTAGLITDGLAANSTSTARANLVEIGGDAGSAVILNQANTYTGGTTVNANATALVANNSALGSSGTATVTSGGRIQMSNGITIGRALVLNGDGISGSGSLQNVSGTNTWSGNITNNSNARINANTNTALILSGNISNAASQSLYLGGDGNITNTGTITGTLATGNGAVFKDGSGTLTLSANNSGLTGLFRMRQGTVSITNANSLGSGVLEFGNSDTTNARITLLINSNTTIANRFEIANNSAGGTIDVASGQTATFTGTLSQTNGTANTTKIAKGGAGTLVLGGSGSTYNGQLQIGNGTVIIGQSGSFGTNTTTAQRGIDLGLDITDTNQANNVSLLTSNNVTISNSIYVGANTNNAFTRTIGITGGGTNTFSNEFYMDGVLTVDAGSAATDRVNISGNLVNTGGLIKTGSGTVVLSGANTYSGTTTISAGTLTVGAGGTTGQLGTGNITNNAALRVNRTSAISITNLISGTGSVTVTNTGAVTLSGANTFTGGVTLNSGSTLNINSTAALGATASTFTIAGGTIDNTSAGDITLANNNAQNWNGDFIYTGGTRSLNLGTGNVAMNASRQVTVSGNTLTVGGVISGNTFGLTKLGTGTLALNGANTFTGGTTISAGAVTIGNNAALGTGNATLSGGALNTDGTARSITNAVVISADSTIGGSGALTISGGFSLSAASSLTNNNSGGLTLGAVTLGNNGTSRTLTVAGTGSTTFGGVIANAAGQSTNNLTITSSGITTLNGNNTYTGRTQIGSSAFVVLGSANALGSTAGHTEMTGNGATLDLNGQTVGAESITIRGTGAGGNGALRNASASAASLSGAVTLDANTTIATTNGAITLSGAIGQSASGYSLTKTGTGSLTLSGANTFSGGVTLSAGTLVIGNNAALGTGSATWAANVTVNTDSSARTVTNNILFRDLTIGGTGALTLSGTLTQDSGGWGLTNNLAAGLTLGNIDLSSSSVNRDLTLRGSGNTTITGVIADGGTATASTLTINASGTTNVLSGNNTYRGLTTITAGALNIRHANALGGTGAGTTVSSGAALEIQGGITVGAEALTLNGTGVSTGGALRLVMRKDATIAALAAGTV